MKKTFLLMLIATVMWQVATAQAQDGDIVWTKYTHEISRLQFSNDDSKILTVGSGGIIIFDTQTGEQVKHLPGYGDGEYSADNSLIVAVRETADSINQVFPYVDIIDAVTYQVVKSIKLNLLTYVPGNEELKISQDKKLITVINEFGLYFIDVETGLIKNYITKLGNETRQYRIMDQVLTNEGNQVIVSIVGSGKEDFGRILFINTLSYQTDFNLNISSKKLQISNNGNFLAYCPLHETKAVAIMNTQTKEIVGQIPGNASAVTSIAFSPDGQYLAVGGLNGMYGLKIYNVSDMTLFKTYFPNTSIINIAFTKDMAKIAFNAGDELVLFRFLSTGIIETDVSVEFLHPNPANNAIYLSFQLPMSSNLNFNLYNISGDLISNLKTGFYNHGQIDENFYLGELANGTYFLKIESLQFNKTYKIIINR